MYQDINNPEKVWARPASMWNDVVDYNGKAVKRFQIVE
ncbi:MAG: DUF1653 domain-containing protein [Eubacterium sp.]